MLNRSLLFAAAVLFVAIERAPAVWRGPLGRRITHPPRQCIIESTARHSAGLPKRPRGARMAKTNRSSASACREQA